MISSHRCKQRLRFSNIDSVTAVTATVLSCHCCGLPESLYKSLLDMFCRADNKIKNNSVELWKEESYFYFILECKSHKQCLILF